MSDMETITRPDPIVMVQARVPKSARIFMNVKAASQSQKLGQYIVELLRAKGYKAPTKKAA